MLVNKDSQYPISMSASSNIDDVINKLHQMKELKQGWCHGYEIPPTETTIKTAQFLAEHLFSLSLLVDVFPDDDNGVLVSCYVYDYVITVKITENEYKFLIFEDDTLSSMDSFYMESPTIEDIDNIILFYYKGYGYEDFDFSTDEG